MRSFLIRGVLVSFFAITGLFGSALTVAIDSDGFSAQTNSAEARWSTREDCEFRYVSGVCPEVELWNGYWN